MPQLPKTITGARIAWSARHWIWLAGAAIADETERRWADPTRPPDEYQLATEAVAVPEEALELRAVFVAEDRRIAVINGIRVHVGDREQKDIAGPHAVGARGVLCTVIKDRPGDNTKADAICKNFKNLPDIIEKLNQD